MLFVIVTFYTVSKINVLCGSTDQKIGLSKGWTYANLLLSTVTFAGGTYWLSVGAYWLPILIIGGPMHIFAALMTILLLHYDFFCCASCCCECCIGGEQVVIHDPCNPASNLVWTNGQVCILCLRLPLKYIRSFESIFQVVDLDNCADAQVPAGEGEHQELSSLGPNAA